MAKILIEPVDVKTQGDFDAKIDGIDPTSGDLFGGTIIYPGGKTDTAWWDRFGRCRDHAKTCNIDPQGEEFADLVRTASSLNLAQ